MLLSMSLLWSYISLALALSSLSKSDLEVIEVSIKLTNWCQFFIFCPVARGSTTLWQCYGVILSSIRGRMIKNWCQFVFYNNKSLKKSNIAGKNEENLIFLTFLNYSAMLLSITFHAWWRDWLLKTSNRLSLDKNLTGWIMPLPCIN